MSPLVNSLWITLIGMALIFASVMLLWGLMDVLMRLTARYAAKEAEESSEGGEEQVQESKPAGADQKKRAAAAAVAIALRLRRPVARTAQLNRPGSAWQAVNRARQLNSPSQIERKSRGSIR